MPVHDWTRVEADIFHHFHHAWIYEIKRACNQVILQGNYYTLAEQYAADHGPDMLSLQGTSAEEGDVAASFSLRGRQNGFLVATPKIQLTAETDLEFYPRKQSTVTVRHANGDRVIAIVEIVSPGNKSSPSAVRAFMQKTTQLLRNKVQLLIIDLHPPGRRDPHGIHAVVWDDFAGQDSAAPPKDQPLTLAAYECGLEVRAYVVPVAVGDMLTDMPLFLSRGAHVVVPLEATYEAAWQAVPLARSAGARRVRWTCGFALA